jgi:hypothetical protein
VKRILVVLQIALLFAASGQAQQYKLATKAFEVTFPTSTNLFIDTGSGDDADWGTPNDKNRSTTTSYLTGGAGVTERIAVTTLDHDIPMTQEVADFYAGKGEAGYTFKDSEGWVYNVISRTRGHFDGTANTVTKSGQWGKQAVTQYWTLTITKYVDLDDNSAHLRRVLLIVADTRTVISVSLTTRLEKDVPADWDALSKSLKVQAGLIHK